MKISSKSLLSFIISCILGLFLGIFISNNIICFGDIQGSSMEPTYYNNDRLLVCKLLSPNRGDIVVFNHDEKCLIKRVIAVPGDSITIVDSNLILNGSVVKESYIKEEEFEGGKIENEILLLGEGQYFVMGDNRNSSYDSRNFGVIYSNDIIGVKLL